MKALAITFAGFLAALLAGSSAAVAREAVVRVGEPPVAGPALAGPNPVWAERDNELFDIRIARVSARPGRFSFNLPSGSVAGAELRPALSVSAAGIAVFAERVERGGAAGGRYYIGSPTGPFSAMTTCAVEACELRPFDVSDDAVAYRACDGAVEVRQPFDASPLRLGSGFGVRISGRYVAWLDEHFTQGTQNTADLIVYDREAGAEAYRIPAAAIPGRVISLDVDSAGTIAVAHRVPVQEGYAAAQVATASPAQPHLVPAQLPKSDWYEVRLVAGRLAYERGRVQNLAVPNAELGLHDLASGTTRLVATGGLAAVGASTFDFDGTRFAWARARCNDAVIITRAVGDPARRDPARRGCRLAFESRPTLNRRGVPSLPLDCGGFWGGECGARVRVTTADQRARKVAEGTSTSSPVKLRLTQSAHRAITRTRGLRVRISASVFDALGRSERRTTVLTLHR